MKKITGSLPFRLLLGVILGIIVGQLAGSGLMHVVVTIKYILNQVIVFCVPLIIIGFIAPSITRLGNNASKMLGVAIIIAYVSSIGAALFSMTAGFLMIPHLSIATEVEGLKDLPAIVFQLDIPQIMPVFLAASGPGRHMDQGRGGYSGAGGVPADCAVHCYQGGNSHPSCVYRIYILRPFL